MTRIVGLFLFLLLLPPLLGGPPGVLPTLEAQLSIREQWQNSPHAGSMDSPEERERMNQVGCARCHTAQGFHHEILGGEESAAPYADATGLTCLACHEESDTGQPMATLRAGTPRDACRGCHDELVANQPDALSWCSQWGIFEGGGGLETPVGQSVVSAHSEMEDGCVGCHLAPAGAGSDPTLVGGHTFRVKTKGELPPDFNSGPCLSCHKLMNAEILADSQAEVREILDELAALLPQRPDPEDTGRTIPRFPADPTLSESQARAAHNYWLVEKDGSLGVHNPGYVRPLLERTIAELTRGRG